MITVAWFECRVASVCECSCEIEPGDLAAWLPGGDDDGAVVCLTCGEAAEREAAA